MPRSAHAAATVAETHALLAPARARLRARDHEIVRLQVELAEIPAPTGEEGERGARVAQHLRTAGLTDVRVDRAGNVLGLRRGCGTGGAPVVVCAHLDTVFPRGTPLAVRRDGARLVGPGIGDNGRGLAVMLTLARELDGRHVRTRRPVLFAATTGEEGAGDLRGAKALFADSAADAHAAIILDGAGDERVVHCALGARRLRVTFAGPGGHSWAAHGVPNPVHAAGLATARLTTIPLPAVPRTTLSVTRIGGGISVNAIPEEAWLEIDLRSTSATLLDRLSAEVALAVQAAMEEEDGRRARGAPRLTLRIARIGERPCGEVPPSHRLVQCAYEATRLVGREPLGATASTDANVPIGLGIPAVAIGAGGRGGAAHTLGEWYENTDGAVGVARALTLITAAAGMG
ncbi:MAG TPA: M20/M25/M40 family metallo-hydrolase [Gemmatimonadaceae bacterium]|nr:M20/M25/M40 family metallo-hydrolase [Gemmatimonadaceae bacterium]